MKKSVAIITAFDPYAFKGGIETYTVQLVELLKSYGIKSDIFHTGLVKGNHGFHNDYLGRLYLTGRMIDDSRYAFVVSNAFYGLGYFPPKIKTYNIFHLTHMGFAEEIKSVVPPSQYLEWKFLWGELAESASGFQRTKIAVSESVKEELDRYYGNRDVTVVENAIDTNLFVKCDRAKARADLCIPGDAFVGLYIGRWDILKGSDILEEVIERRPECRWIIVLGTGSNKRSVPQRDNVTVIEGVGYSRMREIYSAADFLLFPSRYEGFGYVIIEAMACELPVISTKTGVAGTALKTAPFSSFLLPEKKSDREAMVSACIERIEVLRNDKPLRESLGRQERKIIEERYKIERWKEEMSRVLGLSYG